MRLFVLATVRACPGTLPCEVAFCVVGTRLVEDVNDAAAVLAADDDVVVCPVFICALSSTLFQPHKSTTGLTHELHPGRLPIPTQGVPLSNALRCLHTDNESPPLATYPNPGTPAPLQAGTSSWTQAVARWVN